MSEESLTELIKHQRNVLRLGYRELMKYQDLIFLFVRIDFVAFKQTILWPFWFVLQPITQTAFHSIMFGSVFDISKETGVPSMFFYFTGTVYWWCFSQSLVKKANTFMASAHIIGKVYFPSLTVTVSVLISDLIGFGIQFILFVRFFVFTCQTILSHTLLNLCKIPLLIVVVSVLGIGIELIISLLTMEYKGFKKLIGFQLLMIASLVIIPFSIVYKRFSNWKYFILEYNLMAGIIEDFRSIIFKEYYFDWSCK